MNAAEKPRKGNAVLKFGPLAVTMTGDVSSYTLVNAIMRYSSLRSALVICAGFLASTLSVARAQTQGQAQSQAKTQTQAQTQAQTEQQTQAQSQSQTRAQTAAQVQTRAENQTQAKSQTQVQAQTRTQAQSQARPRTSTRASSGRRAGSMIPPAPAPPKYARRGRASGTRSSAEAASTPHTETFGRHDSAGHSVGFYPSTQGEVRVGSQASAYRSGKRATGKPQKANDQPPQ
jgi:hypothetical protein